MLFKLEYWPAEEVNGVGRIICVEAWNSLFPESSLFYNSDTMEMF
jgi:hypothetical protein